MLSSAQERLAGAILLAVALAWLVGVFWAVPDIGPITRIGPRTFPFATGAALAILSLLLIGRTLFYVRRGSGMAAETGAAAGTGAEAWALLATFGFLIAHLMLMVWIGFVPATVITVAAFVWFVLKQRSPLLVAGVSFGLAFGIWLVLGLLMGVYLPHGMLVQLF
jgi:hypothetical protein